MYRRYDSYGPNRRSTMCVPDNSQKKLSLENSLKDSEVQNSVPPPALVRFNHVSSVGSSAGCGVAKYPARRQRFDLP